MKAEARLQEDAPPSSEAVGVSPLTGVPSIPPHCRPHPPKTHPRSPFLLPFALAQNADAPSEEEDGEGEGGKEAEAEEEKDAETVKKVDGQNATAGNTTSSNTTASAPPKPIGK